MKKYLILCKREIFLFEIFSLIYIVVTCLINFPFKDAILICKASHDYFNMFLIGTIIYFLASVFYNEKNFQATLRFILSIPIKVTKIVAFFMIRNILLIAIPQLIGLLFFGLLIFFSPKSDIYRNMFITQFLGFVFCNIGVALLVVPFNILSSVQIIKNYLSNLILYIVSILIIIIMLLPLNNLQPQFFDLYKMLLSVIYIIFIFVISFGLASYLLSKKRILKNRGCQK